eukprot:1148596-Pelagomonas_calceolata.AAC.6
MLSRIFSLLVWCRDIYALATVSAGQAASARLPPQSRLHVVHHDNIDYVLTWLVRHWMACSSSSSGGRGFAPGGTGALRHLNQLGQHLQGKHTADRQCLLVATLCLETSTPSHAVCAIQ